MQDSINSIVDSVSSIKVDSAALADGLTRADSIARADSIQSLVQLPSGMEGIPHLSSPATEIWTFAVLILLFLFFILAIRNSEGEFIQNIKNFFRKKEAVNLIQTPNANIFQFQIYITLFSIGTFSIFIYELMSNPAKEFSFKTYLFFLLATAVFYIVKYLLFEIVGNTFFNKIVTQSYKNMYFSLLSVFAVIIYFVTILYTFEPVSWKYPLVIFSLCMAGIMIIFLIIKIFQIFYSKFIGLLYIFLYLCTLEIIPLLLLFRAYKLII